MSLLLFTLREFRIVDFNKIGHLQCRHPQPTSGVYRHSFIFL